ncbi:MAG: hypothetical protein IPG79_01810 [Saprospiraceae bacterium]|nr:hypothetical protein [Saprospiraceae bacterium]
MIELGLSYDSSFVNLCGGDSLALEKLQELMIEVNSLFDEAPADTKCRYICFSQGNKIKKTDLINIPIYL